jgi:radical SAM superfamily enzyme YgiQ (UPF0313 family)
VADIVLTTLNARFAHAAFGLRYLMANLPPTLRERSRLIEFDINQRPLDVLEAILTHNPKILGIGVYIWNVAPATQLLAELKRVRPDIIVILGGPEVSHETDQQEICRLADYTITGEADLAFADLCGQLLAGRKPLMKVLPAALPEFSQLQLPYDLYDERDVAHRVIYVEASRGCPFKCEFCLSSLDVPVRNAPLEAFLEAMQSLLDRGVRQFKFVDRTFNLNLATSRAILEFFLVRHRPDLFLHFEMIPDRLPDALRSIIRRFPPGSLQFEVGIQSFNDEVQHLISRRQDNARLEDNLRFLREQTGVHVHADLIVGLPGEEIAGFARGFDRLVSLRPQEIQVGMLKRLRGTPIVRHDEEWGMVYSPHPPYEILQTRLIDFPMMQRMRRFARFWDLLANSGNFLESTPLIRATGGTPSPEASPFWTFLKFSDWLFERTGQTHGIALSSLAESLFTYLVNVMQLEAGLVARTLWRDYQRGGRTDRPAFLRPYIDDPPPPKSSVASRVPQRQARHLA